MIASIPSTRRAAFGKIAAGTALAFVFAMALAGPAHADDRYSRGRGDDRDWRAHETQARHWHAHPHPVAPIVYAPPVVYAPPPPPSGINLILPLNFR